MSKFPSTPDTLTAQWLGEQLQAEVSELRIETFAEGTGVIGQVVRAHYQMATPSGAEPRSVIVKFPSPAEENRAVAAIYDMYAKEVSFYRDVAADLPVRTPACYAAEFDSATQAFVLVLEDLKGYRIGDQVAGASLADAQLAVRAIARMHAATWGSDLSHLPSHNNPAQHDGMVAGFELGWPAVLANMPDLIPDVARDASAKVPTNVQRLLQEMTSGPQCLVHADMRLDNMFFGDDAGTDPIALIDWQSTCSSCGEQDLAYFITQSLDRDLRRAHGEELVRSYYDELCGAGVKGYALTQCQARFKTSAMYLMCYAVVIAGTLDLGNERGKQLGRALLGRCLSSLDDLNAFELLA